jgi:hypothetical protein
MGVTAHAGHDKTFLLAHRAKYLMELHRLGMWNTRPSGIWAGMVQVVNQ